MNHKSIIAAVLFCSTFSDKAYAKFFRPNVILKQSISISNDKTYARSLGVVEKIEKIGTLSRKAFVDFAKSTHSYKNIENIYSQSQKLHDNIRIKMSQNLGKTIVASALAGGFIFKDSFACQDSPYQAQIQNEFEKAVEANDAHLVDVLDSILCDRHIVEEAALKHALTNSNNVKGQKSHANLQTFEILLNKCSESDELIVNVVKGGDLQKIDLIINAGASTKKILTEAIKVKNFAMVQKMLSITDPSLSQEDVFVKAKILCDKSLLRRLFFGNQIYQWLNKPKVTVADAFAQPINRWSKSIKRDKQIPEPVIF